MLAPGGIVGNAGGPYKTLGGAVSVHDADVHNVPINELFHRHTGIVTTLAAPVVAGDTSITVVSDTGFTNGNPFQIENGIIETSFPTIISGVGTNTWVLDRPLDNSFDVDSPVGEVTTNMAVIGSIGTPVSFKLVPDRDQTWHFVRFLIAMVHKSAADDSKFGGLAALTNGCVLRGYNGLTDQYRTFTNWKTNFDLKMDMFDVPYTDKAGGGLFGTNGRGSIKIGTGAVPRLVGANGDFLELLVQDDLTASSNEISVFELKGQGHPEGM